MTRPTPPPRHARLRSVLAFFRQHQASSAILFFLAVVTAVAISLIRDDPVVVSQLEMTALTVRLQEFGHMPYRVRMNGPLANTHGLVPATVNNGNTSLSQPLRNQWGGKVSIAGNPEKASEYDITYAGLPSYACKRLVRWAVGGPLFKQVMINGVPIRTLPATDAGGAFDEVAMAQRCKADNHALTLRVEVPRKERAVAVE
jgi:hypothetical protein